MSKWLTKMSSRFIDAIKSLTDFKNKRFAPKYLEASERAKNVAYLHMQVLTNDASLLSSLVLDISETIVIHSGDAFSKGRKDKYLSDGVQDRIGRLLDIAVQMLFIGNSFCILAQENKGLDTSKYESKIEDVVTMIKDVFMSQSQEEFEGRCNDILSQLNGVRTRLKLYPYVMANIDVDKVNENLTLMGNGGRLLHTNCLLNTATNARAVKPNKTPVPVQNNSKEFAAYDDDEGGIAVQVEQPPSPSSREKRQSFRVDDRKKITAVKRRDIPLESPIEPAYEYDSDVNASVQSIGNAVVSSSKHPINKQDSLKNEKINSKSNDSVPLQVESPVEITPIEISLETKDAIKSYKAKDYVAAKDKFYILAKDNNPVALYYIGLMTWHGQAFEKNSKKALAYLEKSQKLNFIPAQTALANIYLDDKDLFDVKKGCKYMAEAAQSNDPEAIAKMGFFNHVGLYFTQNLKTAQLHYSKVKECEDNESLIHSAIMYIYGQGVERDFKIAMELLTKSAAQKNPFGMSFLGYMYANGIGVTTDLEKSAKWYTRCAKYGGLPEDESLKNATPQPQSSTPAQSQLLPPAAVPFNKGESMIIPQHSLEEMFILGASYLKGTHTVAKPEKGINYLEQAAANDHAQAMFELGKYYFESSTHHNKQKSHEYLLKSAQLGVKEALDYVCKAGLNVDFINAENIEHFLPLIEESANNGNSEMFIVLGDIYYLGKFKKQNLNKAFSFYMKASENRNGAGYAKAGSMMISGEEVEKDVKNGILLLEKGAALDDIGAIVKLAGLYHFGEDDVEVDGPKALDYYRRGAKLGSAEAMCKCGVMYHYGQGIPQDYKKAHEYYVQAGNMGNPEAMVNLATIYQYGQGVQRDAKKASEWVQKSSTLQRP